MVVTYSIIFYLLSILKNTPKKQKAESMYTY